MPCSAFKKDRHTVIVLRSVLVWHTRQLFGSCSWSSGKGSIGTVLSAVRRLNNEISGSQIISRVGIPKEILTDQETLFMSQTLKELYGLLGITSI